MPKMNAIDPIEFVGDAAVTTRSGRNTEILCPSAHEKGVDPNNENVPWCTKSICPFRFESV